MKTSSLSQSLEQCGDQTNLTPLIPYITVTFSYTLFQFRTEDTDFCRFLSGIFGHFYRSQLWQRNVYPHVTSLHVLIV